MPARLLWLLPGLLLCSALRISAAPARIVPAAPTVLLLKGVDMAPLRAIAEIGGATIDDTRKVYTVTLGEHSFVCAEGDAKAWHDGELMTLPVAPFTLDGCCYVPVHPLVAALGGVVKGDGLGLSLEITLPQCAPFTVFVKAVTGSPSQLAGAYHLYLVSTDGSNVQQLSYEYNGANRNQAIPPGDSPPALTADGATLLYRNGINIVSRRLDSPVETVLTAAYSEVGSESGMPRVTRDGTVFFARQPREEDHPQLCRMDLDGGQCKPLATGIFSQFSADGGIVAYTSFNNNNPTVHVMNADGSKDRVIAPGFANALSPDGAILYYSKFTGSGVSEIGDLVGVNVSDGSVIWQRPALAKMSDDPSDYFNLDFSPDGKHLLLGTADGLLLMDADGKNPRKIAAGQFFYPRFTADGTKVAFLHERQLFLMNADGSDAQPVAAGIEVGAFTLSPDGAAIVVYGHIKQPPAPRTYLPPTPAKIDAARLAGTQTAIINTVRGTITVALYGKEAPLTVANFVKLVKSHFYDGLTFHRVERDFVIQGGAPSGDGNGGPGYTIKLEIARGLTHGDGALAMARNADPDSAGSQFYITLGAQHALDKQYAVFGKVIDGRDVVKKIRVGDRIVSITMK